MPELTGAAARGARIAALAMLPLLAAAAVAIYRAAGALAAVLFATSATIAGLVALLVASRSRLRRAREAQRVGQAALDAVPLAIFIMEAERPGAPNVYVNTAYAVLTGYGAAEAVADGFDARAIFAADLERAALAGDAQSGSARVDVRRRDGTTFPAKVELRAVPRAEGGRYLVGTIDDVTFGERATDRAAPSTAEPSSLYVDAGGRATGAFLSWLTHELRSPLNASLMWLDVLALGPQADKLPQAIEAIKRGLARQAKLVSDLSDAAKVAAGGFEMRFERVDLVSLVASGVGAWQLLAIGKQVKLEHRIGLAAAHVNGDPERLRLALNHLVENAINSTPQHGRVDLRLYGAGEACTVAVEDSGPALSDEDAANVFAPLERSPKSAKARSGLGLGLAVAHHVAERHGGSLTASTEGSSTRFLLTLPLATGGPEPAAGGTEPLRGNAGLSHSFGTSRRR